LSFVLFFYHLKTPDVPNDPDNNRSKNHINCHPDNLEVGMFWFKEFLKSGNGQIKEQKGKEPP